MNLNEVLKYQLALIPTSMFTNNGQMRLATSKSTLKNKLKVEVTGRCAPKATSVIIDGSDVLWVDHWPSQGTDQDIVRNVVSYVMGKMKDVDVYLIFDSYEDYSINGVTRTAQRKEASRHHQLSLSMHLPPQKVELAVIYNTIQLVDVIVETLLAQKHQPASTNHKLVVTGRDPVPVEISQGMTIRRKDLDNAQEEVGVIVMLSIVKSFTNDINISVISDDTGVFVLLAHFYHDRQLTCQVTMEATSKERKSIDIQATARLHKDISGQLPAAHPMSGCDTVVQLSGIGKTRVVKILKAGRQLSELGNSSAALADVVQESSAFIAA